MKKKVNKKNNRKHMKRKQRVQDNLLKRKPRLHIFRIIMCLLVLIGIVTYCINIPNIQQHKKQQQREEIKSIVTEVIQEQKQQEELEKQKQEEEKRKQEEEQQRIEQEKKQQEEAAKAAEQAKKESEQVTSRASTTARKEPEQTTTPTSNTASGYRITSYYPGDGYSSTGKTGSGKTTANFSTKTVAGKTVYTYQGKIVVATATEELLKSGYNVKGGGTRQSDKHYFRYNDTFQINIDGTWYDAIVLDSCGASMWKGYYRVDIFVPNSANTINRSNVSIKY